MLSLYFGSFISILTIVLVVGMLVFIGVAIKKGAKINKWGRLILLFIIAGTAISAFSGTRDAVGTPDALFAMTSWQALVCSLAGGVIYLTGLISVFFKKQTFKRTCFIIISALFVIQVVVIEVSRIIYSM